MDLIKCYFLKIGHSKHFLLQQDVSKAAKIRNRYNQVPHLTQDTNGKVTNSARHHKREQEVLIYMNKLPRKNLKFGVTNNLVNHRDGNYLK